MVSNVGKQVIVKAIPVNITSARELMRVLCNTAEGLDRYPRMSRGGLGGVVLATWHIRLGKAAVRKLECAFTGCRWMSNEGNM
jgi:hypothetical protein